MTLHAAARHDRLLAAASLLLVAAQLLLPWLGAWPTQDGPSHVYNAGIAWDLLTRGEHSPYAAFYTWNSRPVPNWTVTVLLWLLDERAVASLCIALSYLSVTYALRVFAPGLPRWSPLANALVNSWFLYMGFYNFYLGCAAALAWVAFWHEKRDRSTKLSLLVLAAGAVLLYFTHLLAWAAAMLGAAALCSTAKRAARLASIAAPSCGLAAWYLLTSPDSSDVAAFSSSGLTAALATIGKAWAITRWGAGTQVLLLAAFLLLVLRASFAHVMLKPLALLAALFAAGAAFVPEQMLGGGYVQERLWWFAVAFAVLAAARLAETRRVAETLTALVLALSLTQTAFVLREAETARANLSSVCTAIPEGARLARAVRQTPDDPALPAVPELRADPLLHACSVQALERRQILLSDYQALTGYFPLVLRDAPSRPLLRVLDHSQGVDLQRLLAGVPIDWLIELAPAQNWRAVTVPLRPSSRVAHYHTGE